VFNPRSKLEQYISNTMRFIHPYLFYVTYRFHVEKAREAGLRVEDVYANKFHKEPYIMHHMYAQYFHPHTLLERVRNVSFYRRPRTIYKGFTVPDWAKAENTDGGWEVDMYSRQAWDNCMHDMHSEWTPMQFSGYRQEPNVLQWLRLENYGKGMSSRLFYNEVPQPTWARYGGHMLENNENERERDRLLYSFTHADQDRRITFGMDTTTPEGQAEFRAEYDALCEMAPEIVKKEDFVYPHELPPQVSTEPHFQRVWQLYRDHKLRSALAKAEEQGAISSEDSAAAQEFIGMSGETSVTIYILAITGKLTHLEGNEGFQATIRVLNAVGLGDIEFNHCSSEPVEEQFWRAFDGLSGCTEAEMRKHLPEFVGDPNNRAKVEALLSGEETTQRLN